MNKKNVILFLIILLYIICIINKKLDIVIFNLIYNVQKITCIQFVDVIIFNNNNYHLISIQFSF